MNHPRNFGVDNDTWDYLKDICDGDYVVVIPDETADASVPPNCPNEEELLIGMVIGKIKRHELTVIWMTGKPNEPLQRRTDMRTKIKTSWVVDYFRRLEKFSVDLQIRKFGRYVQRPKANYYGYMECEMVYGLAMPDEKIPGLKSSSTSAS